MSDPIPSLALSTALQFADLPPPILSSLLPSTASCGTWFDALVLSTPFWTSHGCFSHALDLEGGLSKLQAASIHFDPDRELRLKPFSPSKVSIETRAVIATARRVKFPSPSPLLKDTLVELFPNLTALHLTDDRLPVGNEPAFASLTSLQDLTLSLGPSWGSLSLLEPLTSLRRLSLSGCDKLADISTLAALTELEDLALRGCMSRDITPLASLPSLRTLLFTINFSDDALDVTPLASVTSLGALLVPDVPVVGLEALADLPVLHTIRCTGSSRMDPSTLTRFAALKTLHFTEGWEEVEDSERVGISDLADAFRSRGLFVVSDEYFLEVLPKAPTRFTPADIGGLDTTPLATTFIPLLRHRVEFVRKQAIVVVSNMAKYLASDQLHTVMTATLLPALEDPAGNPEAVLEEATAAILNTTPGTTNEQLMSQELGELTLPGLFELLTSKDPAVVLVALEAISSLLAMASLGGVRYDVELQSMGGLAYLLHVSDSGRLGEQVGEIIQEFYPGFLF